MQAKEEWRIRAVEICYGSFIAENQVIDFIVEVATAADKDHRQMTVQELSKLLQLLIYNVKKEENASSPLLS